MRHGTAAGTIQLSLSPRARFVASLSARSLALSLSLKLRHHVFSRPCSHSHILSFLSSLLPPFFSRDSSLSLFTSAFFPLSPGLIERAPTTHTHGSDVRAARQCSISLAPAPPPSPPHEEQATLQRQHSGNIPMTQPTLIPIRLPTARAVWTSELCSCDRTPTRRRQHAATADGCGGRCATRDKTRTSTFDRSGGATPNRAECTSVSTYPPSPSPARSEIKFPKPAAARVEMWQARPIVLSIASLQPPHHRPPSRQHCRRVVTPTRQPQHSVAPRRQRHSERRGMPQELSKAIGTAARRLARRQRRSA